MNNTDKLDILEHRCNIQERLLSKIWRDLHMIGDTDSTKTRKRKVTIIKKYVNEYIQNGFIE